MFINDSWLLRQDPGGLSSEMSRFIQTSRGVRQGWCAKHAVIYADDHHVSFIFKDQVSAPKSACIFTFRGQSSIYIPIVTEKIYLGVSDQDLMTCYKLQGFSRSVSSS
ncbi:unnamed protein product [Symbiodinium sp. CCMP2456]|nr:unnamed protein product [Symbiodinium sp. CCMP2456]